MLSIHTLVKRQNTGKDAATEVTACEQTGLGFQDIAAYKKQRGLSQPAKRRCNSPSV